jgi:3-phosphoshikimate 1-carboxyvinyltransferase
MDMMAQCGIEVSASDDYRSYLVPAPQKFHPAHFRVPGDFALAAYALVVAALSGGRVKCTNLDSTSIQAEKGILTFLQQMGADLVIDQDAQSVEVSGGSRLVGIEWDGNDTPDSVPLMTLVAALAKGRSTIHNVSQLRAKESDRLAAMLQLNRMGARISVFDDRLEIDGVETLYGSELDSMWDHRLAMTWTIAGAVAEGETLVRGVDSAAVSYPDFLRDMRSLGLDYEERR